MQVFFFLKMIVICTFFRHEWEQSIFMFKTIEHLTWTADLRMHLGLNKCLLKLATVHVM